MAEEKFDKSAPKRPSLKVSLPVELFNKRMRKLEDQSLYPISCPEVTSTTGHGFELGSKQIIIKQRADSSSPDDAEEKNETQQNSPDTSRKLNIKNERLE